ncbi:MAG: hypothetical protein M3N43_13450 [Actinomycetota bacterium]|nr:hypothetical protein [Actinomycetota bacterium]
MGGSDPVAELAPSLRQLLGEAQALRADVQSAERARRRTAKVAAVVAGVLAVVVGLLAFVVLQNNRSLAQSRATQDTLVDCTTPAGQCYKAGQKRTAAVVADLIKASTYVAQCARLRPDESGPAFDAYLEACVAQKLGLQPGPSPSPTPGT